MERTLLKDNKVIIQEAKSILDDLYLRNSEFNDFIDQSDSFSFLNSEALFYTNIEDYLIELDAWKENKTKEEYTDIIRFIGKGGKSSLLELVQAIKRKRVAPFVGAGLCVSLEFPSWKKALEEINGKLDDVELPEVEKCISESDYLEAAELLYKEDSITFKSYISDRFLLNPDVVKSDLEIGALKFLPLIADGCVITTNFDRTLEELFRLSSKAFGGFMHGVQNKNKFVTDLIKGDRCLLKLHGSVGEEDSYIFTKSQYDDAYGSTLDFDKALPKTLRQIYISHSLLFLGCSLEKDRTLELFSKVQESKQFEIPQHFAILPEPPNGQKRKKETFLREINIKTIWYPEEEHEYVEKILQLALDIASGKLKRI